MCPQLSPVPATRTAHSSSHPATGGPGLAFKAAVGTVAGPPARLCGDIFGLALPGQEERREHGGDG